MQQYLIHQPFDADSPLLEHFECIKSFTHAWLGLHHSRTPPNLLSEQYCTDINPIPASFNPTNIKLIISDMDSTLITIECIDEIAKFANDPFISEKIANITDQAMNGKINFSQSLTARLALLKDIPCSALEAVYTQSLTLSPGAETLLNTLNQKSIPFALVSGGFTFFTAKLEQTLPITYAKANQLEIIDDRLTGRPIGSIVDAHAKRKFLEMLCQTLNISPNQTIAIGDGANDLEMMKIAGLSIAYQAKPIVQKQCDWQLNHSGLDALTHLWLPYSK